MAVDDEGGMGWYLELFHQHVLAVLLLHLLLHLSGRGVVGQWLEVVGVVLSG